MPEDGEFQRRRAHHLGALQNALTALYGSLPDFSAWLEGFLIGMAARAEARSEVLRARDRACEADPGWFLRPEMIGYSCYVDRFGGSLQGVANRIPYLQSLGIRYLHLLPFWDVGDGDSDGGFAVRDYTRVASRLGTLADLGKLAADLHEAGITLCADLVLNHTADTHPWALAARAGDAAHRAYYHVLADQAEVDEYELSLGQVFPHTAPGNFTHVAEMGGWVWTTFYPFQWDLNYANPAVFAEMAGIVMDLANLGVGALRLDSAAFLWKRKGTSSRSQHETHLVMRALRAMVDIVAPSVLLKSEVIGPVEDAAAYLGSSAAPECHLAYHAGLMTAGWAALAEQAAGTLRAVIEAVPAIPENAGWITYVRCHDDIGWQPLAPQARSAETGFDDASVQQRLRRISDFYTEGGSFARGAAFQSGAEDAAHGINGMAASLVGLEDAGTEAEIEAAIARLMLLYGVAFAAGGLPLIYMGDELGQTNDWSFLADPIKAHEGRWLHRPEFSQAGALGVSDRASVAGRVHAGIRALATARQNLPALNSVSAPVILPQPDRAALVFSRGPEIAVAFNFADQATRVTLPGGAGWLDILGTQARCAWGARVAALGHGLVVAGGMKMPVFGAIEAGGTKFRCAVGETPCELLAQASFPTRTPAETIADVGGFFADVAGKFGRLAALGVGSFGPLDLDPASPGFGSIVRTPKPHWTDFNLRTALIEAMDCPVAIDTDVNASGFAESLLGAGKGLASLAYVTIGTGIGGGLILEGRALHGFSHPEMGHMRPVRAAGDTFAGVCPYHGDCLEGLASGAAIFMRAGRHLADIPAGDPLWGWLADYIGQLCSSLMLIASPNRIVLGGGVMSSNPGLFAPVRQAVAAQIAGYLGTVCMDELIVPPALGTESGLIGGLLLAGAKG